MGTTKLISCVCIRQKPLTKLASLGVRRLRESHSYPHGVSELPFHPLLLATVTKNFGPANPLGRDSVSSSSSSFSFFSSEVLRVVLAGVARDPRANISTRGW